MKFSLSTLFFKKIFLAIDSNAKKKSFHFLDCGQITFPYKILVYEPALRTLVR